MIEIDNFDDQKFLHLLKWFHAQSWEDKMKIALNRFNSQNSNCYRGYMPLVDNVAVYKEQTDFGNHLINDKISADPIQQFMQEASSYPSEDFEKGFMLKVHKNDFCENLFFTKSRTRLKRTIKQVYTIYTDVARLMMRLCAVGLDLTPNHFEV